jgi:hypothetical protein
VLNQPAPLHDGKEWRAKMPLPKALCCQYDRTR